MVSHEWGKDQSDVFTFWVPCCDVRYEFRIKTIFGSSFPRVFCRTAGFLLLLFAYIDVQHILTNEYNSGCVIRGRCLPFMSTSAHPQVFGVVHVAPRFSFLRWFWFVLFVFVLCLICPMSPVSLGYPFLISPSVWSNAYFNVNENQKHLNFVISMNTKYICFYLMRRFIQIESYFYRFQLI